MSFGDFYRGKRVLVTGSTGFKGSWLCQWLHALGASVQGYALPPVTDPSAWATMRVASTIAHQDGDVRDLPTVRALVRSFKPDIVFHLAAQPLVRESYADPKGTFDINVGGTVNLLEAVRAEPGILACVVITTDKCYDNKEWVWGYRECDPLGGHDPYSASKGAAEIVVASYRRSFFAEAGTVIATARAGNVIGGGDWSKDRLVADFIKAMTAGTPLVLRSPNATRPWQHVLEPLSAYLTLAWRMSSPGGRRFGDAWNIGPDESSVVTVERLATSLVAAWGSGDVRIAADNQLHEACLLKLDCSKANHLLGWRGVWDFETTIQRTVDWYQARRSGRDGRDITLQQIDDYTRSARQKRLAWAGSDPVQKDDP